MASRITQEKENKFFKKWDILIYAILIVLIGVLFLVILLPKSNQEIEAISMEYDGKEIFLYKFNEESMQINSDYISYSVEGDKVYVVKFKEGIGSDDFNIIRIDANNRVVTCDDANCSTSKDCTHMKITKPGDTIICIPHKLFVRAVSKSEIPDPVIG